MKLLLTLILILSFDLIAQQKNSIDTTLLSLPNDYIISYFINDKDTILGDFNNDGINDIVLVAMNKDELLDTVRPILIFEGEKNGAYKLAAKNNHLWSCQGGCGYYACHGCKLEKNINKASFCITHWGCFYTTDKNTNEVIGYKEWQRVTSFKYDIITKEYILYEDIKKINPGCGECVDIKYEYEKYNKSKWGKAKFKDYVIELN